MATRRRKAPVVSAGARLVTELTRDGDPFALTLLIEQAGHIADYLERSHQLLSGERDSWVDVKIGAKTVQVQVTNVLVQHRQFTEQLRKLLHEIQRQRAAESGGPDDDDVLDDDDA